MTWLGGGGGLPVEGALRAAWLVGVFEATCISVLFRRQSVIPSHNQISKCNVVL